MVFFGIHLRPFNGNKKKDEIKAYFQEFFFYLLLNKNY